jgi:hypothetical protein
MINDFAGLSNILSSSADAEIDVARLAIRIVNACGAGSVLCVRDGAEPVAGELRSAGIIAHAVHSFAAYNQGLAEVRELETDFHSVFIDVFIAENSV